MDKSVKFGFNCGDGCRLTDRNGGDGDAVGVAFDIILFYSVLFSWLLRENFSVKFNTLLFDF